MGRAALRIMGFEISSDGLVWLTKTESEITAEWLVRLITSRGSNIIDRKAVCGIISNRAMTIIKTIRWPGG